MVRQSKLRDCHIFTPNHLVCYMPSWTISGFMCASCLSKNFFCRVYDGEMIFEVHITFSIQTNVQHLYVEQSYHVCQKLLCYRHKSYYVKKFFLLISLDTILYDMNLHSVCIHNANDTTSTTTLSLSFVFRFVTF